MKKNIGATVQVLAIAFGLAGCATQDDDFVPARRQVGFRPPAGPVVQEELPAVDPTTTQTVTNVPAPMNPLPEPVVTPPAPEVPLPPTPTPTPTPKPVTPPPTPESQAPAPTPPAKPAKPAAPEYAKKVPGKPGFIYNPYTGAILDATGATPGSQVRDPRTGQIMLVP